MIRRHCDKCGSEAAFPAGLRISIASGVRRYEEHDFCGPCAGSFLAWLDTREEGHQAEQEGRHAIAATENGQSAASLPAIAQEASQGLSHEPTDDGNDRRESQPFTERRWPVDRTAASLRLRDAKANTGKLLDQIEASLKITAPDFQVHKRPRQPDTRAEIALSQAETLEPVVHRLRRIAAKLRKAGTGKTAPSAA
jgi:hypothetical protein